MPLFDGTDANDISRYTVSSQIRMLEKLKKTTDFQGISFRFPVW